MSSLRSDPWPPRTRGWALSKPARFLMARLPNCASGTLEKKRQTLQHLQGVYVRKYKENILRAVQIYGLPLVTFICCHKYRLHTLS